jgi:hypothetical protein
MGFALATPIADFQRQRRRDVETGCRGGTEGGEVTAEECCIAPRCRVEPFLDQGGAWRRLAAPLARRQRRALPWEAARRTPGHARQRHRSKRLTARRPNCTRPSSSAPIVQLGVTSAGLSGRCTRSATPTIDVAAAHKDLASTRKRRTGLHLARGRYNCPRQVRPLLATVRTTRRGG